MKNDKLNILERHKYFKKVGSVISLTLGLSVVGSMVNVIPTINSSEQISYENFGIKKAYAADNCYYDVYNIAYPVSLKLQGSPFEFNMDNVNMARLMGFNEDGSLNKYATYGFYQSLTSDGIGRNGRITSLSQLQSGYTYYRLGIYDNLVSVYNKTTLDNSDAGNIKKVIIKNIDKGSYGEKYIFTLDNYDLQKTTTPVKGSLYQSNVVAPIGRYPSDGIEGSYWYVQKTMADTTPINVPNIKDIIVGNTATYIIKNDGTVWGVGRSSALGLSGYDTITKPVQIPELTNISKGYCLSNNGMIFVKNDGTLIGFNLYYNVKISPINVTDIKKVSGCYYGDYIIKNDGTAVDVNNPNNSLNNISDIQSGEQFEVYLKTDGTVWGKGINSSGQMGLGNGIMSTGTSMKIPINDVKSINAFSNGVLYLKNDGTVWGSGNLAGVINQNITQISISNVKSIITKGNHAFFVKNDNTIWMYGCSDFGSIPTTSQFVPVPQLVQIPNITDISTNGFSTYYLKADGTIWFSGEDMFNVMGNGACAITNTPIQLKFDLGN